MNALTELIALLVAMELEGCSTGGLRLLAPLGAGVWQPLLFLFPGDALSKELSQETPCCAPSWVLDLKTSCAAVPPVLPQYRVACGIPTPFGMGSMQHQQPLQGAPLLCPVCGLGHLSRCPFPSSPGQVATFLPDRQELGM